MVIAITSQFDGNYEKFEPVVARNLASLIQQAYQKQFPAWTSSWEHPIWKLEKPFEIVELVTQNVPFGFVAWNLDSKDVFVVFRGTLKFIEWFKNTKIQLVSYQNGQDSASKYLKKEEDIAEGIKFENESQNIGDTDFGRVTVGFRGMYLALRAKMLETLQALPQDSQIYVTGHSLGGALATLAIPDLLQNTNFHSSQITLYTFASPRCGDRTFAIEFQKTGVQHWRIANSEDFVTMIPFPTGNVFKAIDNLETPPEPETPPEIQLGSGGTTGTDPNPNPIFGFFKDMYNRNKRRMPDYVHTGTPIYFTIHDASLERQHNLADVYMKGIYQDSILQ